MFTGIITDVGRVAAIEGDVERTFTIATAYPVDEIAIGASVCHNGVCLTLVERGEGSFRVQASGETLRVTTLGGWREGDRINLERSLRLGDELGGHIVFGHVDGIGRVTAVEPAGESRKLTVATPPDLLPLIAAKGSIALDGISLTVNAVTGEGFVVNVIPHSWAHTNLVTRAAGDPVNLEVDMLARYVARQLALARSPGDA